METNALIIAAFVACLALSFLLSGMEAGVFALSRVRIRQQMRAGRASAKLLYRFLDSPENFLWTIFVGNTVVNFVILGLTVTWLHDALFGHRILFSLAFVASVFLFYAWFDLLPKMLFRSFPNRLCILAARPFRFIHLGLRPLVAVVEWFSKTILGVTGGQVFTGHLFGNRDEFRQLMQESAQAFTSEERLMISRVLDLQNISVRQITVPMAQVVTVSAEISVGAALALCREKHLTRLPVHETKDGQRKIIGLFRVNRVLYANYDETKKASDFLTPALYLNEDVRLETALQRLQRGGQRLAIVLGRDRREIGVVSMEDILKIIFGEVKL